MVVSWMDAVEALKTCRRVPVAATWSGSKSSSPAHLRNTIPELQLKKDITVQHRPDSNVTFVREEKGTQTQTFWSGYLRVGWGSSTRGGGGKKFGMSFETQGNQTFWRDIPGFLPGYLRKFEKIVFNSRPRFWGESEVHCFLGVHNFCTVRS